MVQFGVTLESDIFSKQDQEKCIVKCAHRFTPFAVADRTMKAEFADPVQILHGLPIWKILGKWILLPVNAVDNRDVAVVLYALPNWIEYCCFVISWI